MHLAFAKGNVSNKIVDVPNSTCHKCYQNFENVCRAFEVPGSEFEKEYRERGGAVCLLRDSDAVEIVGGFRGLDAVR